MTASDEMNETMNVGGTRNALALAGKLDVGPLPPGLLGRGVRRLPRRLRRDDVRRGAGPALAVPPHQVRVREDRPRGGRRCRGGSTARRSWSGTPRPARWTRSTAPTTSSRCSSGCATPLPRLGAAGRRRPRRHQRGAGRLRRQGDGPPRAPARPRRPGLPPGQPRAAEHRRADQLLRRRPPRPRSSPYPSTARVTAELPTAPAPPAAAPGGAARARRCGWRRCTLALNQTIGRLGIPPEVLEHVSFPTVYASRSHREGARRVRASRCPTSSPTPRPCGPTGRRCSTTRSRARPPSSRR